MRTDQVLALIGGALGIIIVPVVLASVLFEADPDADSQIGAAMVGGTHIISLVAFALGAISAIVVALTVKNSMVVGCVLLGIAGMMAVISGVAGSISWALLFAGGIVAIKFGNKK
ncbi:MAG: hypothetical protein EB829_01020 [Nitrosopumilus sp. H8]|nr:MAG: hypothetical protein EB830_04250 [Nitrosopumilus sp. H13]RNJ79974.1 MAG: hypothetical protein EB829_01020 [Nitrosopumilus sp. H8]